MKKINLYSLKGIKLKEISLPRLFEEKLNLKLLAQAMRVYSDRTHPGHSKVKTRAEIDRTKKKWYRQKGTGGARHGAKSAPIFVGGGVAHGPKLGKTELTLPIKIRRKALEIALSLKAKEDKIFAVRGLLGASKTSQAQELIDKLYLQKQKAKRPKISFILSESGKEIARGLANLKNSQTLAYKDLNAYQVFWGGDLIMDENIFAVGEKEGKKEAKLKSKASKKSESLKSDKTKKEVSKK